MQAQRQDGVPPPPPYSNDHEMNRPLNSPQLVAPDSEEARKRSVAWVPPSPTDKLMSPCSEALHRKRLKMWYAKSRIKPAPQRSPAWC
mmetsp:Transcript_39132/g.122406  ORF Transcript_39132/g.122406 Transcript_39132/m.122406 type:complete len:88 (-) Transcript_39132:938-1201(-)